MRRPYVCPYRLAAILVLLLTAAVVWMLAGPYTVGLAVGALLVLARIGELLGRVAASGERRWHR